MLILSSFPGHYKISIELCNHVTFLLLTDWRKRWSSQGEILKMSESDNESRNPVCKCVGNANEGEACERMEQLQLDPKSRVVNFRQVTEGGWHALEVDLLGPVLEEGFEARVGHAFVTLPSKKQIYMIGGGNHLGETCEVWKSDYSLSLERIEFELDAALTLDFTGRYEFMCGASKDESKIWIFGGADLRHTKNDVCYIDVELGSVVRIASAEPSQDYDTPSPRTQGGNSCVTEIEGVEYLVVFGGGVDAEKSVSDGHLYMFNTLSSRWKRVEVNGSLPTPVQGHGMVSIETRIYLFGGMEDMKLFNDFYTIDLAQTGPKWNKIRTGGPQPSPRAAFGITVIEHDIFVFGGVGEHGPLCDLWKYQTYLNEWVRLDTGMKLSGNETVPAIPPRLDFAMTNLSIQMVKSGKFDSENCEFLIINGGMNVTGNLFHDFWIYPLFL